MTSIVNKVVEEYQKIWELRDPRVEGWLFMSSPLPTMLICLTYVYIVKVAGPKFMENRKAYEFRNLLIFYNAVQVIFSAWLFYELAMSGWFRGYSYRCQPVDYTASSLAIRMTYACWWYYFSKFTEFFDTFFFVLRKKYQHVSLLHVIHHGLMPMSVWFGVRFTPGGHSTFFGLLNTFVHIVMYFYYMVSAMGPQYQKYIWWKKYLTSFQMVQFVCIFVHAFQLLFIDCDYPKVFCLWIGGHGLLFLFLFSDFYKKSYSDKMKALKARAMNGKLAPDYTNGVSNGYKNGYVNGYTNGITNGYANGSANGHANGSANGHANGSANGRANGSANGHGLSNGHSNGHITENGHANGAANGHVKSAKSLFSFPCFLDGDALHSKSE